MLMAFLKHFFNSQKVVRHGKWHPYLSNRWDALDLNKKTPVVLKTQRELKPEIARIMNHYSSHTQLLHSGVSFPYGVERDTLRRPDIVEMVELLQPHVEFRSLIIYRDPVSCAYSAVRRGFNNNALHQARIVEDNLIFIKQQLEACDLAFIKGHSEIRQSTSKKDIPIEIAEQLEEFFSPLRVKQWNDFLEKKDISNLS